MIQGNHRDEYPPGVSGRPSGPRSKQLLGGCARCLWLVVDRQGAQRLRRGHNSALVAAQVINATPPRAAVRADLRHKLQALAVGNRANPEAAVLQNHLYYIKTISASQLQNHCSNSCSSN